MRNFLTRIVFSAALCGICSGVPAVAQRARIAGLERNGEYMELLREQGRLKGQEDSTVSVLSGCRKQFEANPDLREELGREIVKLEGELFEIRNRMGRITTQVATIEQDYIVNHLDEETSEEGQDSGTTTAEGARIGTDNGGVRTLFANPFFAENLSAADVALFCLTPRVEPEVAKIDRKIGGLYEQLKTVKRQYEAATDQEVIDSLSVRAGEIKEQIEQVDALMERLWLQIYLRKLDCYLVLLDRIGSIDRLKLEQLDQEGRHVRRAEGLAGEQLAPLVAAYPLQRRLALDYEVVMAQALGLRAAEDSLSGELEKHKKADEEAGRMTYSDIPFEVRNVIVYSPITKATTAENRNYTTIDDVPVLQVPKSGVYYTVQIALYTTKPKSIEVLKGMTPVMYQRLGTGQTRYVAGGFATYAEAQAAATQMVRAGLRASVVAFADGKPVAATQAKALEASASASSTSSQRGGQTAAVQQQATHGRGYNLEIVPAELRLPVAVREVIAGQAPGKTIVRSSSGNEVVYVVGSFATQAEADKLAGALRDQPNIKVKVVAL